MTDNATTPEVEAKDEGTTPESGPSELREYAKRLKAENEVLRAKASVDVYAEVGLDPTKGLGKAIAKEYDGNLEPEDLAKFALEEYGWERPEAPENPKEPAIVENQKVIDDVNSTTTAQIPPSEDEALRTAEAAGDFETTRRIKADRLARMLGR
jgi:hypothetical protein